LSELKWSDYDFTKIPFDELVRVGQRTMLYRDMFTVSWLLGRFCNYRCSYCWPYARSDKKDHRPTHLINATIDEIKRQARANNFNSFHFSLSGGEPTFHPGYLDILGHLASDVSNTNYTSVHMTSNCSRPLKWFEQYVEIVKPLHRASITSSLHVEHVNTKEKMQEFADKLILCQEHDVQITINMVMVPDQFERDWDNALFFHEQGINVTLKPQSDPTASKVVDGYTRDMLKRLYNGMPQRAYTDTKAVWSDRPRPQFQIPTEIDQRDDKSVPWNMQVEFKDANGETWYMDQAERFNAFNFNKFKGWECSAGYRSIIIREPDGSIKRSYSCADVPLGNIETGFNLFDTPMPCISDSCVSSADSKIPKRAPGTQLPLWPGDKTFDIHKST
jgi:organic radical activating enzyme|tara:strand:+ start:9967 stop:11133 length:1167 start_codon:yes stop_codon:yes gene_type:complete